MDFTSYSKIIWAQFVTAWANPAPVFAVGLLIWVVLRQYYKALFQSRLDDAASREKTAEEHKKLLERQLQEYKDKTGSDNPDEVKDRLQSLEDRIQSMSATITRVEGRNLTEIQKELMGNILDLGKGAGIAISVDGACSDGRQYSSGIASVFSASGWNVKKGTVVGFTGDMPSGGIRMGVPDSNNLSNSQKIAISALNTAKIPFDLCSMDFRMFAGAVELDLFITSVPTE